MLNEPALLRSIVMVSSPLNNVNCGGGATLLETISSITAKPNGVVVKLGLPPPPEKSGLNLIGWLIVKLVILRIDAGGIANLVRLMIP